VVQRHFTVGLFGGVMVFGLAGCQSQSIQPSFNSAAQSAPQLPPLPQAPQIQVYMNQNPAASYAEPYRQQTRPGDNLEQHIIDAIATARTSVEVAVQEFRLPGIAQALRDRHQAGVNVRVILENTYSRPLSQLTPATTANLTERGQQRFQEARQLIDLNGDGSLSPDEIQQRDALVILDRARIPRIDDTADGSAGSNLMHHKFVVIDGQRVIVTSANFTTSDVHGDFKTFKSRGNANNLLDFNSPGLAQLFRQEFDLMWGDGVGGKPDSLFGSKKPARPAKRVMVGSVPVQVQFSPNTPATPWKNTSNGLISKILNRAKQSISMALFVFSDQQLVDGLQPLHHRGVAIKTLIDPSFMYRSYSSGLDMLGVRVIENCQYDAEHRPWNPAIATVGVPRMPPGDLLHHKFGIVDQRTVVTGSHNWTAAANTGNDETVLVIHSPIVAAHYQREFERLYQPAILGIPPAIRKKVAQQARDCANQAIERQRTEPTIPPLRQTQKMGAAASKMVNLNTASQAELEGLPGVGAGLAKRIIAARQQRPFNSLADFDQVSGVGPSLINRLKHQVTW
jgi:phosphatidylserine/phosphatidylglycerophosphate/cardiolipin synthase-like enzyme